MQLALLNSQCTVAHPLPSLQTDRRCKTNPPPQCLCAPTLSSGSMPPTSHCQLPLYLFSAAITLLTLYLSSWIILSVVKRPSGDLEKRRLTSLFNVHEGNAVDKVQTSLPRCGGKRVTVELKGLIGERSRYPNRSPNFSSMLLLPKPSVAVTHPHLPCGEDLISSLASAPGKA